MSERFTVMIDDCPHEDVKRVIAGEQPSNALVLYVRCMFAGERERSRKLGECLTVDMYSIVSEVIECCHLDARLYGLSDEEATPFAVRIIEAADVAHLRGEKSPI